MFFKNFRFLRLFVSLLLIVFFTDTVYASGMMVADQLHENHTVNVESHDHEGHDMVQNDHHKHDSGQKQSTNDKCSKCGHCLACFTVLPPNQLLKMQSHLQAIAINLFEPSYLSHITSQPQRPPIS